MAARKSVRRQPKQLLLYLAVFAAAAAGLIAGVVGTLSIAGGL